MPTTWPSMRAKPHTMFIAQSGKHLEEVAVVDDLGDDLLHVVRLVRRVGDEVDDPVARALGIVGRLEVRRVLEVVRRQERQQVAHLLDARLLVVGDERRDARLGRVRHRAAELFLRDVFTGDRLHDVGTGDEHVRHALHHEDEVGHRGRVDRAARARPEHDADLRDHARRLHVAEEDAAVRTRATRRLLGCARRRRR